jgi:hypothetical protein
MLLWGLMMKNWYSPSVIYRAGATGGAGAAAGGLTEKAYEEAFCH